MEPNNEKNDRKLLQSVIPTSTSNLDHGSLNPFIEIVPPWSYQDQFSRLSISSQASSTAGTSTTTAAAPATEPSVGFYLDSLLPRELTTKLLSEEGSNSVQTRSTKNPMAALMCRVTQLESQVKLRNEIIRHIVAAYHVLVCTSSSSSEYLDSFSNCDARRRSVSSEKAVVQASVLGSSSYPTNNRSRSRKGCCSLDQESSSCPNRKTSNRGYRSSNGNHECNCSSHHCEEHCSGGRNSTSVSDLNFLAKLQLRPPPNYTSLEEIKGKMLDAANDQSGCMFLLSKIEGGKKEEIDLIFNELQVHLIDLMVEHSGSSVVEKIIEFGDAKQRSFILYSVIQSHEVLWNICCDSHGSRAVQILLAHLTDAEEINHFMSAMQPMVFPLITGQHSHHVIRHCFQNFTSQSNMYLIDAVVENCVDIATDSSGCRVLQQCVQCAHREPKQRLVTKIAQSALLLSKNAYGNYVVQYVLKMKIPHVNNEALAYLKGNFTWLSMQKFSSNVVQTCLNYFNEDQSSTIIKELVEESNFLSMCQDPYGNFVMQTALEVSEKMPGSLFLVLKNMILRNSSSLHSHPYGQRVLNCSILSKYQCKTRGR